MTKSLLNSLYFRLSLNLSKLVISSYKPGVSRSTKGTSRIPLIWENLESLVEPLVLSIIYSLS